MTLGLILLLTLAAAWAYVRLAPSDPQRWHIPLEAGAAGDVQAAGSILLRRDVSGDGRAVFEALALAFDQDARTTRIAGSADEGHLTYLSRSQVVGFPDYTTLSLAESAAGMQVVVFARLRFGISDLGANARRVRAVLGKSGLPETE